MYKFMGRCSVQHFNGVLIDGASNKFYTTGHSKLNSIACSRNVCTFYDHFFSPLEMNVQ